MSLDSARAFYDRLVADEPFRESVQSAADPEARLSLLRDAGFDFTQDELEQVTVELADALSAGEPETVGFAFSAALGVNEDQPLVAVRYGPPDISTFYQAVGPVQLVEVRPPR